jgi:hypothetical protein
MGSCDPTTTPSRALLVRDDSARPLVLVKMPWYLLGLSLLLVGGLLWFKRRNPWGLVLAGAGVRDFVDAYLEEKARQRAVVAAESGSVGVPPGIGGEPVPAAAADVTSVLIFAWSRVLANSNAPAWAQAHGGEPIGDVQMAVARAPGGEMPPKPFDDALTEKPPTLLRGKAPTLLHDKSCGDTFLVEDAFAPRQPPRACANGAPPSDGSAPGSAEGQSTQSGMAGQQMLRAPRARRAVLRFHGTVTYNGQSYRCVVATDFIPSLSAIAPPRRRAWGRTPTAAARSLPQPATSWSSEPESPGRACSSRGGPAVSPPDRRDARWEDDVHTTWRAAAPANPETIVALARDGCLNAGSSGETCSWASAGLRMFPGKDHLSGDAPERLRNPGKGDRRARDEPEPGDARGPAGAGSTLRPMAKSASALPVAAHEPGRCDVTVAILLIAVRMIDGVLGRVRCTMVAVEKPPPAPLPSHATAHRSAAVVVKPVGDADARLRADHRRLAAGATSIEAPQGIHSDEPSGGTSCGQFSLAEHLRAPRAAHAFAGSSTPLQSDGRPSRHGGTASGGTRAARAPQASYEGAR